MNQDILLSNNSLQLNFLSKTIEINFNVEQLWRKRTNFYSFVALIVYKSNAQQIKSAIHD
jgi:hypothetical protein